MSGDEKKPILQDSGKLIGERKIEKRIKYFRELIFF